MTAPAATSHDSVKGNGTIVPDTGTAYVILERTQHNITAGDAWQEIGTVTARTAEAAIRDAVAGDTPTGSTFVAIPARSFKPVTVKTETVTTLKLEDAK